MRIYCFKHVNKSLDATEKQKVVSNKKIALIYMMWVLTGAKMKTISWISDRGLSKNNFIFSIFEGRLQINNEKQDRIFNQI